MPHIHRLPGRVSAGIRVQLGHQKLGAGVARSRRIAPVAAPDHPPTTVLAADDGGVHGHGATTLQTYGQAVRLWQPNTCTADAMHSRALTVTAEAALLLHARRHGAPMENDGSKVVGCVSRTNVLRALPADRPLDLRG